jgi:hypothetical protein
MLVQTLRDLYTDRIIAAIGIAAADDRQH